MNTLDASTRTFSGAAMTLDKQTAGRAAPIVVIVGDPGKQLDARDSR